VTAAGGSVDMATLNTFCSETTCSVSLLYDQSGNANDLPQATPANQPTIAYWSTSDGSKLPMAVTVSKQWLRIEPPPRKSPLAPPARPSTSSSMQLFQLEVLL